MRYSRLFAKTLRAVSSEVNSLGHEYLLRGGFIKESSAGRYYMLPLGMRVQDKICKIVDEEMQKVGGQKVHAPTLHALELWEETKRTAAVAFELMQVKDRHGAAFVLGGTAEEMFVDLVRKFEISYKDLPLMLYQFSTKFRDELRARGGLLRVREFLMKDAYSFDTDAASFAETYEQMKQAYSQIFSKLGLKTAIVAADNGYMGGEYAHEFVVEHEVGESKFFVDAAGQALHEDLVKSENDVAGMRATKGIEVGNIFQLGTYYSEKMKGADYIAKDSSAKPYYMGCYGLGIGRTLQTLAEIYNDKNGIIWPAIVAPFDVHLVVIGNESAEREKADELYLKLCQAGVEVLYDDRDVSAGVKFADADLIGVTRRLVVSARGLKLGEVEYKCRKSIVAVMIRLEQVCERVCGQKDD